MNKKELVKDLRSNIMGIFHTHKDMESLQDYIEKFNGREASVANLVLGLTYNTTLKTICDAIEKHLED